MSHGTRNIPHERIKNYNETTIPKGTIYRTKRIICSAESVGFFTMPHKGSAQWEPMNTQKQYRTVIRSARSDTLLTRVHNIHPRKRAFRTMRIDREKSMVIGVQDHRAEISTRPEFTLRPAGSLGSLLDNKSWLMIYPYLCSYRTLYTGEVEAASTVREGPASLPVSHRRGHDQPMTKQKSSTPTEGLSCSFLVTYNYNRHTAEAFKLRAAFLPQRFAINQIHQAYTRNHTNVARLHRFSSY